MFKSIAPRYDLINHVLSLNLDRLWRRAAVKAIAPGPADRVLDACAGTLDLSLLLAASGADVTALDFCRDMLVIGRGKAIRSGKRVPIVEADATRLPFAKCTFDAATVAFGVRNLDEPAVGLRALVEVLKPGGRLAVLEFSRPRSSLVRAVFEPYFHRVLPRLGAAISGNDGAYSYLPESVKTFLAPDQLVTVLEAAGLEKTTVRRLAGGTVVLITGVRSR